MLGVEPRSAVVPCAVPRRRIAVHPLGPGGPRGHQGQFLALRLPFMRRWSRRLAARWQLSTQKALYALYTASLLTGIATLALGIHLDSQGYWDKKPFLTNVASGFTGACFGLP